MTEPANLKFSQDYVVRTPRNHGAYALQLADWNRLKRMIRTLVPARRIFQNLSSVLFGVTTSAVFAVIGIGTATGAASWVLPTTWAVAVSSLVLAIVLLLLDGMQKSVVQASVDDVLGEMRAIEDAYAEAVAQDMASSAIPTGAVSAVTGTPTAAATGLHGQDVAVTAENIRVGERVLHRKFGAGYVTAVLRNGANSIATVEFDDPTLGEKRLVIAFASLIRDADAGGDTV